MFFNQIKSLILLFFICFLPAGSSSAETDTDNLFSDNDFSSLDPEYVKISRLKRRPYISSYWDDVPSIRICDGSGVTMSRAQSAVHMWRKLGYAFGNIYWDHGSQICLIGGISGEITILLARSDTPIGNNLAITRTFYNSETKIIQKAQIFVLGGYSDKPRLLEHEIGHALGWAHFNRTYHIMNSNYPETGSDTYRVRHSDYQSHIQKFFSSEE